MPWSEWVQRLRKSSLLTYDRAWHDPSGCGRVCHVDCHAASGNQFNLTGKDETEYNKKAVWEHI